MVFCVIVQLLFAMFKDTIFRRRLTAWDEISKFQKDDNE